MSASTTHQRIAWRYFKKSKRMESAITFLIALLIYSAMLVIRFQRS